MNKDIEIYSRVGFLHSICASNKHISNQINTTVPPTLKCSGFDKYMARYVFAYKVSMAGSTFSALAGLTAIYGAFLSCKVM